MNIFNTIQTQRRRFISQGDKSIEKVFEDLISDNILKKKRLSSILYKAFSYGGSLFGPYLATLIVGKLTSAEPKPRLLFDSEYELNHFIADLDSEKYHNFYVASSKDLFQPVSFAEIYIQFSKFSEKQAVIEVMTREELEARKHELILFDTDTLIYNGIRFGSLASEELIGQIYKANIASVLTTISSYITTPLDQNSWSKMSAEEKRDNLHTSGIPRNFLIRTISWAFERPSMSYKKVSSF